jgi:polyhydroxybutyrate depolymerase
MRLLIAVAMTAALLAACGGSTSNVSTHRVLLGGFQRTWYELKPPKVTTPAPLVVMLDGFGGTSLDLIPTTGVEAEAARDGFVVALPQSLSGAWNAGECCTTNAANVDDVGFVANIISGLVADGTAKASRVYVIGYSNGGMLAYRIGCQLSDQLAGIAVVEGSWTYLCAPHKTVPAIVLHQAGDPVIPPNGTTTPGTAYGDPNPFPGVLTSAALWLVSEGCTTPGSTHSGPTTANPVGHLVLYCFDGTPTDITVALGGSHQWPKTAPLDGMSAIATFFHLRVR